MEQQEALLAEGPPSPRPPSPPLPLTEGPGGEGDSSSAGSGVALGPMDQVSAQLINNITMLDYRSLGNSSPLILDQEDLSKSEVMVGGVSGGKLPNFVSWNWTMIRAVLFWGVLSGLLACLATVVALVASLPRSCDPEMPWYRGGLFYEVFPASFQDSNGDGFGDLRGLASRVDYFRALEVKAVRLNSIFKSESYPERYKNVTSLMDIDDSLGTLRDMSFLVTTLHDNNISIILDLPVYPFLTRLDDVESVEDLNNSSDRQPVSDKRYQNHSTSAIRMVRDDRIATAIRYWVSNGIDGFYLKGLENLVDDLHFSEHLKIWKKIIGPHRILIVSYETILRAKHVALNNLMYKTDLVDVFLDVINGTENVKSQVDSILKGVLWSKPGYPWTHWSVGNVDSRRLSASLTPNQTVAVLLLNMMLPGTPSIFYGDEVGLREILEPEEDFHESKHIHNLITMNWPAGQRQFSAPGVLPWLQGAGGAGEGRAVRHLAALRPRSPSIYLNAVWKEGVGLPNAKLRHSGSILVVERWYPRRNSFLLLVNLGEAVANRDLSSWFYGGVPLVATDERLEGRQLAFRTLELRSAEALVIKLEK